MRLFLIHSSTRHYRTIFLLVVFSFLIFIFRYFTQRVFLNAIVQLNSSTLTFSPSHPCLKIDQKQIEIGRKHFAQSRVIICGLIRDREEHLQRFQKQIYQITRLFADYAIVIVENDSRDRTRDVLRRWSIEDRRVHLLGCSHSNQSQCQLTLAATKKEAVPSKYRIEKMVRLRNIYMDYIDQQTIFHRYDYVIVEDYDLTTLTYINGLFSTAFHFDRDPTIDAICSNGITYHTRIPYESYFDPYAHQDYENQQRSFRQHLFWSTLFRHYRCEDELQWVKSCFSGRTIYRYEHIRDKRYRTYLNRFNEPICEHVGLHDSLQNIYLNGQMVFYIIKNNLY